MSELDKLFAISISSDALTPEQIKGKLKVFQIGDKVSIPVELIDDQKSGSMVGASVKQVCTYHIVFQLDSGLTRSIRNADCLKILHLSSAGFSSYGQEELNRDLLAQYKTQKTNNDQKKEKTDE